MTIAGVVLGSEIKPRRCSISSAPTKPKPCCTAASASDSTMRAAVNTTGRTLGMHFDAGQIGPSVSDGQILALLKQRSNAAFLMTILVTKHYDMRAEAGMANELFAEYGKESTAAVASGP